MPSLPSTKRFYSEDFKDAPDWFQQFLSQLNSYSEPMFNILNAGVGVTANTTDEIYIFQVQAAGVNPEDNEAVFEPKKFVGAPNGIVIGQCIFNSETGVATAIGNPVTFDWIWTGSQVKILAIYGLTAGSSYTLSLRIY